MQFTNASSIADSCVWTFGDGFGFNGCGPVIGHTYTNTLSLVPQNYQSQLITITDLGCRDTLSRIIRVKPLVVSDFSADTVGCSPLATTLRSNSFGAITYRWDFGDGATGNGLIAPHTYVNTSASDITFRASLIAESVYQCNDTSFLDILVHPTPIPDFTPSPLFQVYPNATVNVQNQSNPGNWNFEWDYGDNTIINLRNPAPHLYSTWGIYDIQLKASTAFCSDSIFKSIEIDVPFPIARLFRFCRRMQSIAGEFSKPLSVWRFVFMDFW